MFEPKPMDKNQLAEFLSSGEPDTLEYFKANVEDGFDNSTLGVAIDVAKETIAGASSERATPAQAQENIQAFYEKRSPKVVDPASPQLKKYTLDDYKKSKYFRDGIEFQEGWSEDRAKYLAESFDERQTRQQTIEIGSKSDKTLYGSGLVGQMVGGLPDPINFIPFGGAASKSARIGEKLIRGAVEGAVGNVAVSAITRPYYEKRGVDSDWQDYMNDLFIGGAMGGGFAAGGHVLSIRKEAKLADREKMAKAGDAAVEAMANGDELDLNSKLPAFNEEIRKMRELPEIMKERSIIERVEKLEELGYTRAEAEANMTIQAQQAEFFSMYGKDFESSLADIEASEIKNGVINPTDPESFANFKKVNDLLETELLNMKEEIQFAEKGGQKIFNDGQYVSTTGEGTFPDWYADAGVKNKQHLDAVLQAKKGPVYARLKAIAETRLENGYESPAMGRVEPVAEYLQLKQSTLFQFAGPKAKTAPVNQLNEARLLEMEGVDPETIRQKTGWFKAKDQRWRFEIDDSNAKFKSIDINKKKKFKLSEVIDHPSLFEAYPQLKEMGVEFAAHRGRKGGHFDQSKNTIKIMVAQDSKRTPRGEAAFKRVMEIKESPEYKAAQAEQNSRAWLDFYDTEIGREFNGLIFSGASNDIVKSYPKDLNTKADAMNVILHEIQHSIQSIEGFARGGSASMDGGFNNYRNLLGEIEARDTEARKGFSPEERTAKTPAAVNPPGAIIRWRGQEMPQELPALTKNEPKGDIFDATPQTLLKKSKDTERGAITFKNDKAVIHLFKDADRSTFIHETGHLILRNLQDLSRSGNAMAKRDLDIIQKWVDSLPKDEGVSGATNVHEKFARGFEQYLMEGKAPNKALEGVFERFKGWLKAIYRRAEKLNAPINDDIRGIFSKILGEEVDVAPTKQPEPPAPRFTTDADLDQAVNEIDQALLKAKESGVSTEDLDTLRESLESIAADEKLIDEAFTLFQSGSDDVAAAAKAAGVSKSKMQEIIDAFNEKLLIQAGEKVDPMKAMDVANQLKMELAIEAKELKRQAYLSGLARSETIANARKILEAKGDARSAILSQIEGDSSMRGIEGAGNSLDGNYRSLSQATLAKLHSELKGIDPKIEKMFEDVPDFNENVLKEMINPGSTGDGIAKKAAEILGQFAESNRVRENMAGAKIGKLDGWTPRTHDADKIILAGEDAWVKDMREWIDTDRSFVGLNGAGLERALGQTYQNLATGVRREFGEVDMTQPLRRLPRNISKKAGESRVLHFKNAEAELAYLRKYGQGTNVLQSMVRHLDSSSRRIALLEKFGPNPESTLASTIEEIRLDIREKRLFPDMSDADRKKQLERLGDKNKITNREGAIGKAVMFALGEGSSDEALKFKRFSQFVRALNSVSKLGSATLSQFSDFTQLVNERRLVTGDNYASAWVDTLQNYIKGASLNYRTKFSIILVLWWMGLILLIIIDSMQTT